MDDTQTVFRMAMSMVIADPESHLSKWERDYWIQRLQVVDSTGCPIRFPEDEREAAMPYLLHYADLRSEEFGQILRRILQGGEPNIYIRHGTQLELVDAPHHGNADQPRWQPPLVQRRSSKDASKKRKG